MLEQPPVRRFETTFVKKRVKATLAMPIGGWLDRVRQSAHAVPRRRPGPGAEGFRHEPALAPGLDPGLRRGTIWAGFADPNPA